MTASAHTEPQRTNAPAWVALALLTTAYIASYVDRTIITLLVGPIRADLAISDTEFSLLSGLAFALFYTILGVPMARLADRGDRPRLIAVGVFIWSLMTAAGGLARSFGQLFAARIGVGIGEAALSPAAYSLITDLTPRRRLGLALGVYGAGVYAGIGLTFVVGGAMIDALQRSGPQHVPLLGTLAPWQLAMLAAGLPGLLLSALLFLLLPEPRRTVAHRAQQCARLPLLPYLRTNAGFLAAHFIGFAMLTMVFNGYLTWLAEDFLREFGWPKARTGVALGSVILIAGVGGMLAGGAAIDWLARRGVVGVPLKVALAGAAALLPWPWWATLSDNPTTVLTGVAPIIFFSSFSFGPAVVSIQTDTPPGLRAQVSALYLFVVNLAGIGFGGTAVALTAGRLFAGKLGPAMALVGTLGVSLAVLSLAIAVAKRRRVQSA